MPLWVTVLVVCALLIVIWVRHRKRGHAEALLDEHARRRTTGGPAASTPVSRWREANRLFRAGDPEGLRRLEVIAAASPRHRQAVVATWLAALRGGVSRGLDPTWRTLVERTLVAHLRPGPGFWPGMALDADGAILVDLDLSGCRVGEVSFRGAVFVGDTRLTTMTVTGTADFTAARFLRHADFHDTLFARSATFAFAVFCGNVSLAGARVTGDAVLSDVKVSGRATLSGAEFSGAADLRRVFFGGRALFTDAVFGQDASFAGAWFRGRTDVGTAIIAADVDFTGARFGHRVHR
ncbi:hypothetical protein GCM10022243_01640 [Saccharothrix violaceirubra]|uniref:Pentapeptide repeat protein n=1 Tax=Saccharothrix violaceirubra TaxID=413306 RepID=A0A7W7T406_9PSEU|nr:pentapeptide repeat-containing protein [Saccharothrix violaceirubra]MBB4965921.1 hypothetical protein [Saccharothrix violaceirubra]